MNDRYDEIDIAKIETLVAVLKTALPELVAIALAKFKAELPRILPGLTDEEWDQIRRAEDRRRMSSDPQDAVKWDEIRRIEKIKTVETVRIIYRNGATAEMEGPQGLHRSLMERWKKHCAQQTGLASAVSSEQVALELSDDPAGPR